MARIIFLCCSFVPGESDRAAGLPVLNFYQKQMEQLNRIEIKGTVGSVRLQTGLDRKMARLSVVTNYAYKDRSGAAVLETTWMYVVAWEGKDIASLDAISKGDKIWVVGRLKNDKYTGADGTDRYSTEIVASKLAIIDTDESFSFQV